MLPPCMVHVRLFAQARVLVRCDCVTVTLPAGARLGDLRRELNRQYPALGILLCRSGLAFNDAWADDDLVLPAEGEVDVVPPVSGG